MPKTYNNLWDQLIDPLNLYSAFKKAKQRKILYPDILRYDKHLESNLLLLRQELITDIWRPHSYKEKVIKDPKLRIIHAPMFKDRVLHHALLNVIYDLFDKKMIYDSYSCRIGKGKDACRKRLKSFVRHMINKYGNHNFYYFKGDISKFYDSINHEVLLNEIKRCISDKKIINLLEHIIKDSNYIDKGVPIGAATSQIFANIVMNKFDHYVKDVLGIKCYLRYADDFIILHKDKKYLQELLSHFKEWINDQLKMILNPKSFVDKATHGIDFAGYIEFGTHTKPRKRVVKQFKKKLNKLSYLYSLNTPLDLSKIRSVVCSYLGIFKHCDAYKKVQGILNNFILTRGTHVYI